MRILGIDYGAKRVGVALSDDSGTIAFPHSVLSNNPKLIDTVLALIKENNVEAVVLGESRNFKGEENEIMKEIRPFKVTIEEKSGVRVLWEAEFMTSQAAERIQGKNDHIDASAAALILQSYLDKKK